MQGFETILVLLLASTALAVLARRTRLPVPVVMVLGGLGVALVPHLPVVQLEPDLAFAIFVPPLLFGSALTTSARGLRASFRAVLLLAVGLVVATTVAVGLVAHFTVHELTWPSAFVLGTIVAPPDAVVALAIAHALRLPRNTVTVLEGETLLNDTAAFILYRLAVRAATTGSFDWTMAVPRFFLAALVGALIGWIVYQALRFAQRWLRDPTLENVAYLLAPFAAFIPAEAAGASGVLAVVVAGLLLRRGSPLAVSARTRVQAQDVYDVVEFVLNSLIFVLIGMQLGHILRDPAAPPIREMLRVTAIVSGTIVAARIVWVLTMAYVPRLLPSRKPRRHAPFYAVAIVAWTGMRGGDSLVTALALPVVTVAGTPLPGRDLIIAATFGVILALLLLQGLTLSPLIRLLKIPADHARHAEETLVRQHMIAKGDAFLADVATKGEVPTHLVDRVKRRHVERNSQELGLNSDGLRKQHAELMREVERDLVAVRRRAAFELRADGVIDDAVLRHIEHELDLEELSLAEDDD